MSGQKRIHFERDREWQGGGSWVRMIWRSDGAIEQFQGWKNESAEPVINDTRSQKQSQQMLGLSRNALLKIAFLMVAATLSAQTATITWHKTTTSANFRSSFGLNYASSGSTITAIVNPRDSTASYNVLYWRPNQFYPVHTPFQVAGPFTGPRIVTSNSLDSSGMWRVQIQPTGPNFIFTVELKVDNNTVGRFAGLASPNRVFTIYTASTGTYTITLNLSTPNISSLTATLYGPFPTLSASGGNAITAVSSGSYDAGISFSSSGNSYYYLSVAATDALYLAAPLLRLTYQTDTFQCPYSQDVGDYNMAFANCRTSVPSSGFPCLTYDHIKLKCIACFDTWIPNDQGVCIQNTNCGQNQYYSFGNCYNVIDNCVNFEKFGGTCNVCASGYNLVNNPDGTQICNQIAPTCAANQYLLGNVCKNYVANCANFLTANATCEVCKAGYYLQDNICFEQPTQNINCPIGQRGVNGICQLIDPNCIFYNNNNQCQICSKGYLVRNGQCFEVKCGPRQFSMYGNCTDVSPTCGDFDRIYGNCLTCIDSFYVLLNDGRCVQTLDPSANGVVAVTCQAGYFLRDGTCVQVSPLCDGFNNVTGACTSCKDTKTFFVNNGACVSKQGYCASIPRTYFQDGQCMNVSNLCDTFNPQTGACTSCRDNTQLDQATGICKYNEICGNRQYYLPNGACAAVNVNCTTFDPSNGQCTGCIDGLELNAGGVCCLSGNYLDNPVCVPFLKENCLQNNDKFGFCLECKPGTAKPNNQYFGKCQVLGNSP